VIAYFQQHYGDTVLESPPRQGFTALIWLAPLAMLLLGGYIVLSAARGWRAASPEAATSAVEGEDARALPDDQRARLRAALQRELDAEEGLVPHRGMGDT
jgi:cytochrome c-type biogenesis protein CcmH/NrfF